jgi:hypothetical protein
MMSLVDDSEPCFLTIGRTPWMGGSAHHEASTDTGNREMRRHIHALSSIQTLIPTMLYIFANI